MFEILLALIPYAIGIFHEWTAGILSAVLLVMIIIKARKADDFRFPMDMLFAGACLIPLSFLISPLWAVDKGMTVLGFTKFLPLPLSIVLLRQYKKPLDVLKYIPLSGAVMTVLSFILGLIFKAEGWFLVSGRLAGFFQYPNTFALFLLVGLCYIIFKEKITKLEFGIGGVLVIGIFLSGSRTVFVLLVLVAILYIIFCGSKTKRVYGIVSLAVALLVAGGYVVITGNRESVGRFLTTSLSASTFVGRFLYFKDAFFQIIRHPLGLGYMGYYYSQSTFQTGVYTVQNVHNDLLQILIDIGWIPTIILGIAIVRNFIKIDRRSKIIVVIMFLHLLFDFDMQFICMDIIFLSLLIDYEADPEILKKKVSPIVVFTIATLLGIYFAIPSFLSYVHKDELALKVYPCFTKSHILMLSEADTAEAMDARADKVLEYNDSVSLAYSAKARASFSRGDVKEMIKYKTAAIERNKYSIIEYTDYIDMLGYCANLYIESGDYDSAQYCIDKIKEVPGMLENVRSNTSSLAYKIKDKPELDLPEEYMKIIENA